MKCIKKLCHYVEKIKSLDTFPVSTSLRSNGETSYKTWLGAVTSIGYYCLLLWAIITIGRNVLNKNNPSTQEAEKIIFSPNPTEFTPSNFPLMFGIETKNPSKFYIDETIYVAVVEQKLRCKNGTKNVVTIPISKCDPQRHAIHAELTHFFQTQYNNSDLYCIDNNATIYGDFDADEFQYVRIRFGVCQNTTANNNHCKPIEEITSKLSNGYVSFYYPSYNRDLSNYTNPMTLLGRAFFTTIGIEISKAIDFLYEEAVINTDKGAFYAIYDNKSYSVFSDTKEMLDLVANPEMFVYADFKMSTKQKQYYREYSKIVNFISDLGGFIQIIFVVVFFLLEPITDFMYLINLLNSIYQRKVLPNVKNSKKSSFLKRMTSNDFSFYNQIQTNFTGDLGIKKATPKMSTSKVNKEVQIPEVDPKSIATLKESGGMQCNKNENEIDAKTKCEQTTSQVCPFGTEIPITQYNMSSTNSKKILEKTLKTKLAQSFTKKTFSMNICQFLKYKFKSFLRIFTKKCESKTDIKYRNWFEKIEEKVEITYILSKLREIDKLKMLIFNRDQIILFNYLSKPIISEVISKDYTDSIWDIIENPNSYHGEAFQAYQRVKSASSTLDNRFIEFIDEEAKAQLFPETPVN